MKGKLICFDIGTRTLKMAFLENGKCQKTLSVELPDQLVENGEIIAMDAMADFIKETVKEKGFPKGNAAIILPESQVFTHNIVLPPMNEKQLLFNLPFEFRDYVTEEKDKYFYDYAVQEIINDEEGNAKEMHLFGCATLISTINAYRKMFQRAGYTMALAVPDAEAYINLTRIMEEKAEEKNLNYCYLDLGDTELRMHILTGDKYESRRIMDFGGRDIDRCIAEQFNVDIHVAHTYKLNNYENVLESDVCKELYNRMAVEIMKGINFYNYNNRNNTLNSIIIGGGCAAIQPLFEAIDNTVSLKAVLISDLLPELAGGIEAPWSMMEAIGCGLQD